MKKHAVSLFLVASCAMVVAGGCAKQDLVKNDEPMAPAVTSADAPSVKMKTEAVKEPTVNAPTINTETVSTAPIKETSLMESTAQKAEITDAKLQRLQTALDNIYFDFDASKLSDQARATLAKDADILKKASSAKVRIEGNCDERGSDEYNLALGEQRAKAASKYLVAMGIPAKNLTEISYGKEKPADPRHEEAAWAKNRRAEFIILSK